MREVRLNVVDVNRQDDAACVDPCEHEACIQHGRSFFETDTVGDTRAGHEDVGHVVEPGDHCAHCDQVSEHESEI